MPSLRVPVKLARRYQVLTRYAYCRTSQCHWTDRGTGNEVEEQAEAHVVGTGGHEVRVVDTRETILTLPKLQAATR
jgi:hypothetical protein